MSMTGDHITSAASNFPSRGTEPPEVDHYFALHRPSWLDESFIAAFDLPLGQAIHNAKTSESWPAKRGDILVEVMAWEENGWDVMKTRQVHTF